MKKIVGTFVKQTWTGPKNDTAMAIETVEFDATQAVLKLDLSDLHSLRDHDESSDQIGRECVTWPGPCEVTLTDAVAEFFELGDDDGSSFLMERITQEQLDKARNDHPSDLDVGTLLLDLRVTYSLNGESIETMRSNLEHMVRHAIGNGLLTGSTDAEVDSHEFNIALLPAETILEVQS